MGALTLEERRRVVAGPDVHVTADRTAYEHLDEIIASQNKMLARLGKPNDLPDEAEEWLEEGEFPEGSMGPKVRAAIRRCTLPGRRRRRK